MFSFFCVCSAKKRQKETRIPSFFFCALCRSKIPPQKKCDVLKCKKNARAPLFFLISVRCAVRKDPAKKSASLFFPSYQYVSHQKEWRIRSASTSLSFIILFKCKNGGNPQLSLVGQAVWRISLLSESFWVQNLMVPNFIKKNKMQRKESKTVA